MYNCVHPPAHSSASARTPPRYSTLATEHALELELMQSHMAQPVLRGEALMAFATVPFYPDVLALFRLAYPSMAETEIESAEPP